MRRRPRAVLVGLLLSVVVMLAAGPAVALTPETEVTHRLVGAPKGAPTFSPRRSSRRLWN